MLSGMKKPRSGWFTDPEWYRWLGAQSWVVVALLTLANFAAWLVIGTVMDPGLGRSALMALLVALVVQPIGAKLRHRRHRTQQSLKLRD